MSGVDLGTASLPAIQDESQQITAEDFYQLSDFVFGLHDAYGNHPARSLAQLFVQTLARVVEPLQRVVEARGHGVERRVVARAAEFGADLPGGLFDLAQFLLLNA